MVIADLHTILNAVPRIAAGEMWVRGDVRENDKEELGWELENCDNGMGYVSIRSNKLVEEPVRGLVWGAGDRRVSRCCFPTSLRRSASLEENPGMRSPKRFADL